MEQLEVVRPFPGASGKFDKRGFLAIEENSWHTKNIVRLTRLFVVRPDFIFVFACAQIFRQHGGVDFYLTRHRQDLQQIGDVPFVHMIGAEQRHVEALKGGGAMLGQDALYGFVGWDITAGKARIFPGFPAQLAPTVYLLQQKSFPGNLQGVAQLLFDTSEPLRGSPGVGSNIAVPDGQIVGLSHTKLLLWFTGVARQSQQPMAYRNAYIAALSYDILATVSHDLAVYHTVYGIFGFLSASNP